MTRCTEYAEECTAVAESQAVLNDTSIDPQSRAIIRYAMEINDPWPAELVRRVDKGEISLETIDLSQTPTTPEQELSDKRVRTLADIICRNGDEPEAKSAALLVLMSLIEEPAYPKSLANKAKHLACARCGELNLYGMVDAQVATVESELSLDITGDPFDRLIVAQAIIEQVPIISADANLDAYGITRVW
jgi:hypothetical protein